MEVDQLETSGDWNSTKLLKKERFLLQEIQQIHIEHQIRCRT